ncbi:DUF6801 domain-containing protein [Streptomyces sp. Tu 3180]|uniref:DUF6801 domain-containing protein n=1 Tax=Streptomyces sp. Tu 3180 TaxID=2682611 RepID=UPI00135A4224|nr:DUF6801 domain-containing protein [Streptomyces sp. Tu 3180]KAF3465225.1 hypothetical protein GL259_13335 [Streptomyces sp. Tu 3180]
MRGHRAAAPRAPRVRAGSATIGAFVVLAAMVPAAASAAVTQEVDTALPYVCAFPSGERPATVRIAAAFPDRAEAGEAFSPSGVTTTVELPAEAVADLTATGAATARAATRLGVDVAQGAAGAAATWRGSAGPVALPGSGPLTLTSAGDVPSVTGRGHGDLTFSAGALALDLELGTADGTAAEPGSLTVDCSLSEDAPHEGLLATVPVGPEATEPGDAPASPGPSSGPSSGPPSGPRDEPEDRQGDRAPEVTQSAPGGAAADRDAPPCRYDDAHPSTSASLNAYVTGYTNVKKLKGASLLPLSCVLIEQGPTDIEFFPDFTGGHLSQHSEGTLRHQGRPRTPPFEATFLTFGFTPTKATMVLEQTGPMTMDAAGETSFVTLFTRLETRVRVPLVLRVTALEVNGTPLEVGPDCRTEGPLRSPEPEPGKYPGDHLVLSGSSTHQPPDQPVGYLLSSGGPLTGEAAIPAFTGCGAGGEDLDRLLTASVSGPGNHVRQIQGQTCAVQVYNENECTEDLQPRDIPVPER